MSRVLRDLDWGDVLADAERCHDESHPEHVEGCEACGPIGPQTEEDAAREAYFEWLYEESLTTQQ